MIKTAVAAIAETASGSPNFPVSTNRDNTPLTAPMIISNAALYACSISLLFGFDISKKATISGGAMKNISFVMTGISHIRLAAMICLIRSKRKRR